MLVRNNRGYVLVTTMIALAVVTLLATATLTWAETSLRLARKGVESEQALYLANAGVEDALAQFMAGQNPTAVAPHTLTVSGSLQGSYSVTLTTQPDQSVSIVSTGVVGKSTRVVTAVIQPASVTGGTGGTVPGVTPPGVSAQVYQQTVFTNGSLSFNNNNALICGDLYVVGSVDLGNNSWVVGSPKGNCSYVSGTGKVFATGSVLAGNNTVIDGGWCDATHWGPGTPCSTKPTAPALPGPDISGTLSTQATIKYNASQVVSGAKSYNNDIVYINGNLTTAPGLVISGSVTFVATGSADIQGNLTCSGSCSVGIIAANSIVAENNETVWATLVTPGQLTLGNQVTLHGNIQAGTMTMGNGPIFYPINGSIVLPPTPPSLKGWKS